MSTIFGAISMVATTMSAYTDSQIRAKYVMDIEKCFRVAAPQSEVWEFITSVEKVAPCMPGVKEVHVQSPGQYTGVINVKVGPIKTSIKADVKEIEQRAPEFISYSIKGEEGGRASRLTAETRLSLAAVSSNQTDVEFKSHAVIVGRLGKFAGGVMNKLADSMSEQFIAALRLQLEPQAEVPVEAVKKGLWTRFVAFLRRLFGFGQE
jgi:carbon monoxide dehydrogenase subunit G